jgi:hypothetical protein
MRNASINGMNRQMSKSSKVLQRLQWTKINIKNFTCKKWLPFQTVVGVCLYKLNVFCLCKIVHAFFFILCFFVFVSASACL